MITPQIPVTREFEGRLPARAAEPPLTAECFATLCDAWRAAGYCLVMWNSEGQLISTDTRAASFWRMLVAQSGFEAALKEHVLRAIQPSEQAANEFEMGNFMPLLPDLVTLLAPISWRGRPQGAIMACATASDLQSEAFARLCDQCKLDRQAMQRLARQGPVLDASLARRDEILLQTAIRLARKHDVGEQEIAVLTHNLESTYEELHLIYSVSAMMGLPQKPCQLLNKVGTEVAAVSRASTIAFVLAEYDSSGAADNAPAQSLSLEDRVVAVGTCEMTLHQLDNLAEKLATAIPAERDHLVINDVRRHAELAAISPMPHHVVALPMRHESRLMGLMMAINCNDCGDFTSVDVQLLRAVADRVAAFLQNQRLYDDLADLLMGLLHAIVNSVDAKDPYTLGHSERVAYISRALARAAGLPEIECERIYLAGLLHDVGKIGVPDAILSKPGKLTIEEFDTLKKHPEIGVRILSPVRQTRDLLPGVLYHHERIDGGGYPEGLAGSEIPLLGRIICLADCFDAMTTNRTYRAAMPLSVAVAEIRRCSGTQFDPELAEIFLSLDVEALAAEARGSTGADSPMSQIGALATVIGKPSRPANSSLIGAMMPLMHGSVK